MEREGTGGKRREGKVGGVREGVRMTGKKNCLKSFIKY